MIMKYSGADTVSEFSSQQKSKCQKRHWWWWLWWWWKVVTSFSNPFWWCRCPWTGSDDHHHKQLSFRASESKLKSQLAVVCVAMMPHACLLPHLLLLFYRTSLQLMMVSRHAAMLPPLKWSLFYCPHHWLCCTPHSIVCALHTTLCLWPVIWLTRNDRRLRVMK